MTKIDISKRQRIMKRSMKLGHCICDPKRPCPCKVFTGQGICPCAGERPEPVDIANVKLTELVHNAGCASKIAASDLELFLSRLPEVVDPAIISGLPAGDDAAVYKLTDDIALVQTVDVFTPCVDDPFTFGKICAANCLSDIYAMGAAPKTALSVLAFPSETMNGQIMYLMLKGAMETLAQAHCSLLGGHSIKDDEIKLGFAITGIIAPGKSVALESAKAGDSIVLTKPLGVGVLSFARQIGKIREKGLKQAEASMMTLNRAAAEAMMETGVSACTDITGFGLFGHLTRMLRHSGVSARIFADALPSFEGALDLLAEGVIPGAIERNSEFVGDDISVADGVTDAMKNLGFDAQTSGGLMITVPKIRHKQLMDALEKRGVTGTTIGEIYDGPEAKITVTLRDGPGNENDLSQSQRDGATVTSSPAKNDDGTVNHGPGCCADVFGANDEKTNNALPTTVANSQKAFGDLMRSCADSGAIDARTKELISWALVIYARCQSCVEVHFDKALAMGISRQELDEAAWNAIAMGGAPVKMFYGDFIKSRS